MSMDTRARTDLRPQTLRAVTLSGRLAVKSWMYRDRKGSAEVIVDILDDQGRSVGIVSVRVPYPRPK